MSHGVVPPSEALPGGGNGRLDGSDASEMDALLASAAADRRLSPAQPAIPGAAGPSGSSPAALLAAARGMLQRGWDGLSGLWPGASADASGRDSKDVARPGERRANGRGAYLPLYQNGGGAGANGARLNGGIGSSISDTNHRPPANANGDSAPATDAADVNGIESAEDDPKEERWDSLDLETVDNAVARATATADTAASAVWQSVLKWSMVFSLGILTALAAFAVNLAVENLAGFKFWVTLGLLTRRWYLTSFIGASSDGYSTMTSFMRFFRRCLILFSRLAMEHCTPPWLACTLPSHLQLHDMFSALYHSAPRYSAVYLASNCALVAGALRLTALWAPEAAGSGIPEVKSYLNGIDVPGLFAWRTLAVKLIGSVGAVAGGLATGKEGPFVHAGACLAALLSQARGRWLVITVECQFWFEHPDV